jgi:ribulose-5-phosphate 4-epimerase/fuculose-1-phosphate aldolase
LRVDLAAFYRILALYGWDDLLLAHISARLPDEHAYLINPFGLLFSEITASSLLKKAAPMSIARLMFTLWRVQRFQAKNVVY